MNAAIAMRTAAAALLAVISASTLQVVSVHAQETAAQTPAANLSPADELKMWNGLKTSTNADDFYKYLELFPNGMFFDPAKAKYETLSGKTYVAPQGAGQPATLASIPEEPVTPSTTETQPPQVKKKVVKKKSVKRASATASGKKLKKSSKAKLKSSSKKKKVASSRKSCTKANVGTAGCKVKKKTVASAKKKPIARSPDGGGGNGGGGSSGGGGGWGG